MNKARAIRIAAKWSQGHVCTLREGEAQEYHKLCLAALREQEQRERNEPLTLEELMVIDAPVWCVCKPIEGGDGYWCLCRKGLITTPAGSHYYVPEIPHWVFLRNKPKEGAEG